MKTSKVTKIIDSIIQIAIVMISELKLHHVDQFNLGCSGFLGTWDTYLSVFRLVLVLEVLAIKIIAFIYLFRIFFAIHIL